MAEDTEKVKEIKLDLDSAFSSFDIDKDSLHDPKKFSADLFWGPVKKSLKSKGVKDIPEDKKRSLLRLLVEHFRDLNKKHVPSKDPIGETKKHLEDLGKSYSSLARSLEKISHEPKPYASLLEFFKKEGVHSQADFLKKIPTWDGFSYQLIPNKANGFGEFRELKKIEDLFSVLEDEKYFFSESINKKKTPKTVLRSVIMYLEDVSKKAEGDLKRLDTIISERSKIKPGATRTLISIPAVEDSVQDMQLVNRAFKRNVLFKELSSAPKDVDISGGDPLYKGSVDSVLDSLLKPLPEKEKNQAVKEDIRTQELQFVSVNEMLDSIKEATAHISEDNFEKIFKEIDEVSKNISETEDISVVVEEYSPKMETISKRHTDKALAWIFKMDLNEMSIKRGSTPPEDTYENEKEKESIKADAEKVDEFIQRINDVKSVVDITSSGLKNILEEGVYHKVFAPMRKFINFYNRTKEKTWFKKMLRGDTSFVKDDKNPSIEKPSEKEAASKAVDMVSALKEAIESFKEKLSKYKEFLEDSGILDMINRLKKSTHFKEEDYPDKGKFYTDVRRLFSDKFTPEEFEEFVDKASKLTSKSDIIGNFKKKMDSFITKAVSSAFPKELLGQMTAVKLKEKSKEEEEGKKTIEDMSEKEKRQLLTEPKEAAEQLKLAAHLLGMYDNMPRLLIAKKLREISSAIDVMEIEKKRDHQKGDKVAPSQKNQAIKFDKENKLDFFQKLRSFKDRPSMFKKNGMTFGVFTDMFDHSTNDDEFLREWFDKSKEGTLDPEVFEELSNKWATKYIDKEIKREFSEENPEEDGKKWHKHHKIDKKIQQEHSKIENHRDDQRKAMQFIKDLKGSFAPLINKLAEINKQIKDKVKGLRDEMQSRKAASIIPESILLEQMGIVKIGSFDHEGESVDLYDYVEAKKDSDPYSKDESRPEENVPNKEEDEYEDKQSPRQKKKEVYDKIFPGKRKIPLPERGKHPLDKIYSDIKEKLKEVGSKIELQKLLDRLERVPDENGEVNQFLDGAGLDKDYERLLDTYEKVLDLAFGKAKVEGEGDIKNFSIRLRELPEAIEKYTSIYSSFVSKYEKKLDDHKSKIFETEENKQDLEDIKKNGLDPVRMENFKKLYMAFMWRRVERLWSSNLMKFQSYFNVNFETFEGIHDTAKKLFGEGMASRLGNIAKDIKDMIRGGKVPPDRIEALKTELSKIKSMMFDAYKDKTKAAAVEAVHKAVKDEEVLENFGVEKPKDPKEITNKAETKIQPVLSDMEKKMKELVGMHGALKTASSYMVDPSFNHKVLHGYQLQRKIAEMLEKESSEDFSQSDDMDNVTHRISYRTSSGDLLNILTRPNRGVDGPTIVRVLQPRSSFDNSLMAYSGKTLGEFERDRKLEKVGSVSVR